MEELLDVEQLVLEQALLQGLVLERLQLVLERQDELLELELRLVQQVWQR